LPLTVGLFYDYNLSFFLNYLYFLSSALFQMVPTHLNLLVGKSGSLETKRFFEIRNGLISEFLCLDTLSLASFE
jgi:hypothetical protein